MPNVRKKLARKLAKKAGVSYQGAINLLNASKEAPSATMVKPHHFFCNIEGCTWDLWAPGHLDAEEIATRLHHHDNIWVAGYLPNREARSVFKTEDPNPGHEVSKFIRLGDTRYADKYDYRTFSPALEQYLREAHPGPIVPILRKPPYKRPLADLCVVKPLKSSDIEGLAKALEASTYTGVQGPLTLHTLADGFSEAEAEDTIVRRIYLNGEVWRELKDILPPGTVVVPEAPHEAPTLWTAKVEVLDFLPKDRIYLRGDFSDKEVFYCNLRLGEALKEVVVEDVKEDTCSEETPNMGMGPHPTE